MTESDTYWGHRTGSDTYYGTGQEASPSHRVGSEAWWGKGQEVRPVKAQSINVIQSINVTVGMFSFFSTNILKLDLFCQERH